ncbi:MAG: PAS domain S-box protein [Candidatus Hydrothermarchaeaceae archaeon]
MAARDIITVDEEAGGRRKSAGGDRYRELVEKSLVGVYIIQDGVFKHANAQFLDIVGREESDVIGARYKEIVAPESLDKVIRGVTSGDGDRGDPKHYVMKALKKDGRRIDLEVFSVPISHEGRPAIQGIAIDITERGRIEEDLRKSELKFKTLVEEMQEGLWISDENDRTVYWNKSLEKMLGYRLSEVMGKSIYYFANGINETILRRELEKRRQNEPSTYEIEYTSKSGESITVTVSGVPSLDENGNFSGSFAIISDVSDRKKMDCELIKYTEQLRRSNMLKDLFADIVHHDFLNLLGIIRSYTELLIFEEEGTDKRVDLDKLAGLTSGYSGADLKSLCKRASMNALRRVVSEVDLEKETVPLEKARVTWGDFKIALKGPRGPPAKEAFSDMQKLGWDDVGGLNEIKEELKEVIEWPIKLPKLFDKFDVTPPKGILLHGPPGSGKTLIANVIAREAGVYFTTLNGPEVMSRSRGGGEADLRNAFKKARDSAPSIIFIDEIDAIPRGRDEEHRALDQLVSLMDDLSAKDGVIVIGATNSPDVIGPLLKRAGRFERDIEIGIPKRSERKEILEIHARGMPLEGRVDDETKLDKMNTVLESVEKVITMIEDSNKLARLETEEEPEFANRNLDEMIEASIDSLKFNANAKKIAIEYTGNGEYMAELNPVLEDVFLNLISNAITFSPEGSKVIIVVSDEEKDWKVMVKDNGPGVPDKYKKNIFERFMRASKEGVKGTGLGLAIVERVVSLHDGRVWIEDNPEGGSIFYVVIPKKHTPKGAPVV